MPSGNTSPAPSVSGPVPEILQSLGIRTQPWERSREVTVPVPTQCERDLAELLSAERVTMDIAKEGAPVAMAVYAVGFDTRSQDISLRAVLRAALGVAGIRLQDFELIVVAVARAIERDILQYAMQTSQRRPA